MSYQFYKILHLAGVLMIFLSVGAALVKAQLKDTSPTFKKNIGITHGIGLLLALLSGFSIITKIPLDNIGWIVAKIFIWVVFDVISVIAVRRPDFTKTVWIVSILLGALAAYLAVYKPF